MGKVEATDINEVSAPVLKPEDKVYVKVPATDLFDQPHPGVRINRFKFEAGKTYSVKAELGAEVEDRLARFHIEQVRLLRPNADQRAMRDVNRGSQWTSRGGGSITTLDGGLGSLGSANEKVITVDL